MSNIHIKKLWFSPVEGIMFWTGPAHEGAHKLFPAGSPFIVVATSKKNATRYCIVYLTCFGIYSNSKDYLNEIL